jgi:subtilisin family serine protease
VIAESDLPGEPDLLASPPWRRPPRTHFPGIPAWGAPTDSLRNEKFGISDFDQITPDWAWGGSDGEGARVAVLDSGIDGTHPMVRNLDRSVGIVPDADGDFEVVDCEPADTAGHGTACAGIISSIAPAASLTSVRVLTNGKHGTGAGLIAGLRWAVSEGFDVINMSLSTGKPQFVLALHDLADEAYFRRCVLVASAHNLPVRSYPWPFASVISVASHDETDSSVFYYNPSPPVDFFARGLRVEVAWPGGKRIRSTGNSFATPHIAGLCARILGKHPMLTPFQLKSVLYLTASNVTQRTGGDDARH